jgi:hypothetical protein
MDMMTINNENNAIYLLHLVVIYYTIKNRFILLQTVCSHIW